MGANESTRGRLVRIASTFQSIYVQEFVMMLIATSNRVPTTTVRADSVGLAAAAGPPQMDLSTHLPHDANVQLELQLLTERFLNCFVELHPETARSDTIKTALRADKTLLLAVLREYPNSIKVLQVMEEWVTKSIQLAQCIARAVPLYDVDVLTNLLLERVRLMTRLMQSDTMSAYAVINDANLHAAKLAQYLLTPRTTHIRKSDISALQMRQ